MCQIESDRDGVKYVRILKSPGTPKMDLDGECLLVLHGAVEKGTYRNPELFQPSQEVIGDGDLLFIFAFDGESLQLMAKSGDLGLKVSCSCFHGSGRGEAEAERRWALKPHFISLAI